MKHCSEALQKMAEKRQQKCDNLVEDVKHYRSQVASLESALKSKTSVLAILQNERKQLDKDLLTCRETIRKQTIKLERFRDIDNVISYADKVNATNEELTIMNNSNNAKLTEYESTIENLRKELLVWKNASSIKDHYNSEGNNLMTIYYDYGKCQVDNHFLQNEVGKLISSREELQLKYDLLNINQEVAQSRINELEIEASNSKAYHEDKTLKLSLEFELKLKSKSTELHDVTEQLCRCQQEITALQDLTQQLQGYLITLGTKYEKALKESELSESNLHLIRDKLNSCQEQAESLMKSNKELNQQNQSLNRDLELKRKVSDDYRTRAEKVMSSMHERITNLEADLKVVSTFANELKVEKTQFREEIKLLSEKSAVLEKQFDREHELRTSFERKYIESENLISVLKQSKTEVSAAVLEKLEIERCKVNQQEIIINQLEVKMKELKGMNSQSHGESFNINDQSHIHQQPLEVTTINRVVLGDGVSSTAGSSSDNTEIVMDILSLAAMPLSSWSSQAHSMTVNEASNALGTILSKFSDGTHNQMAVVESPLKLTIPGVLPLSDFSNITTVDTNLSSAELTEPKTVYEVILDNSDKKSPTKQVVRDFDLDLLNISVNSTGTVQSSNGLNLSTSTLSQTVPLDISDNLKRLRDNLRYIDEKIPTPRATDIHATLPFQQAVQIVSAGEPVSAKLTFPLRSPIDLFEHVNLQDSSESDFSTSQASSLHPNGDIDARNEWWENLSSRPESESEQSPSSFNMALSLKIPATVEMSLEPQTTEMALIHSER